ncbi:MAG: hypothetical protein IMZ71_03665 [Chloroflexi bacterium]|nr:hypothetical protein [Chloroflexota bacterium]
MLLWNSRIWTLRDKVIGTLVLPGGLASAPFVFAGGSGNLGLALAVLTVVLPVLTSIYLSRRANRLSTATS